MDTTRTLVIVIPTAFVTGLALNLLSDNTLWPWLVSLAVSAVAGVLCGLVALFLYNLIRKP